jgi:hypothetical protein
MLLVRPGGALRVAGVFLFVVRPAINDSAERAFDHEPAGEVGRTTTGDHLSAASFAATVRDIRAELGGDAELLDLTVTRDGGSLKYRTGDGAAGLTWGEGRDGLEDVDVTLVGPGKLEDNVFPIAKLSPGAAPRLTAAVTAKAGNGFVVDTMSLGLAPVSGRVQWTVTGERDGGTLVFTARPDGSRVRRVD